MDAGEISILVLAGALALVPGPVDRWALRRGASPEALIGLAVVTLAGLAAVPVAFALCAGGLAAHTRVASPSALAAIVGLAFVAIAAGRTLARVIAIRRRWKALSQVAASLEPRVHEHGVQILPVEEMLAFASGSRAYVSRGLLERLGPEEQLAVIAHEREHAQRGHGRVLAAALALSHGAFGLAPVSRASAAIDRELDALADRAAARRLGDPGAVKRALETIAAHTVADSAIHDAAALTRRLERLDRSRSARRPIVDDVVALISIVMASGVLIAVCLSIHARSIWLGVMACTVLVLSLRAFIGPALARSRAPFVPGHPSRWS